MDIHPMQTMSKLSDTFRISNEPGPLYTVLKDHNGFTYSWNNRYKNYNPTKLMYVQGPSHMAWSHWRHVLEHNLTDYFIINSAELGKGNEQIISDTERDIKFLEQLGIKDLTILIVTSMPGMNKDEFTKYPHKLFSTATDWFQSMLTEQLQNLERICAKHKSFITTGLTPNPLGTQKSLLDFCMPTKPKPEKHAWNLHAGTYEYLQSISKTNFFNFDHIIDLDILEDSMVWINSHQALDQSLHINHYEPYENLLQHAMENLT